MLELHESGFDPEQHHRGENVARAATAAQVADLRTLADRVHIAPEVRAYIAAITRATREDPALSLGASPRATVALMRVARAGAVMEGRDFVTPDDVKARANAALRHRVMLAPEVEVEGRGADDVITSLLSRIPTPA